MANSKSLAEIQRLSALSDGIFAVAMTLLAFNVHLPATSASSRIPQELARMLGEVGGLLLSFAIAAMFWFSHLRLFQFLHKVDFGFRVVNFAFLLSIVLLPISTGLWELFARSPEVMFVLGGNLLLISLMNLFLWIYGLARRLLSLPPFRSRQTLLELIPSIFPTFVFCFSLVAMKWNPAMGIQLWSCAFAAPLVGHLARRWLGSSAPSHK